MPENVPDHTVEGTVSVISRRYIAEPVTWELVVVDLMPVASHETYKREGPCAASAIVKP